MTLSRARAVLAWAARPRIALALTMALALAVAIATLTPADNLPPVPGGDKLHHFLAFGLLAVPMAFARPQAVLWIILAVSAYGGVIEIIQPYVGRHGDVMDALANAAGAVSGGALGVMLRRAVSHMLRARL